MNTYVRLEIGNDELVTSLVNVIVDNPNMASVVLYMETKDINVVVGCSQTRGCLTTTIMSYSELLRREIDKSTFLTSALTGECSTLVGMQLMDVSGHCTYANPHSGSATYGGYLNPMS